MLSMDAFLKRCADAISKGTPFLAYRHSRGHFFLLLECDIDVWDKKARDWKPKHFKAKAYTAEGFHKAVGRMMKDPKITDLDVVEFAGTALHTVGGDELDELYAVQPGGEAEDDNAEV